MSMTLFKALTAIMTACATTAVTAQDITLNVWGDPVRKPFYRAFDESREDISVKFVSVASNELVTKLQLALRSGDGIPDAIFMPDVNMAAQLSTRRANYLMDLSDNIDDNFINNFYPTALAPCTKNGGALICLRNDVAHFMLWYNAPLMEELGLSVPTTWEEYEKVGKVAAEQGIVSGAIAMHMPIMNFLYSNGCDLAVPLADDNETLQINATAPQCIEAAQLVDRMIDSGALTLTAPFDPEFIELAMTNKVLMIPGPTWFGEFIIKDRFEFAEGTASVALTPRWASQDEPVAWSWGGGVWGAWKDTTHPEAVVDLLEFVTSDIDTNREAVTMPAYQPASVEWGATLDNSNYYVGEYNFRNMVNAAEFGHPGYVSLRIDTRTSFTKAVVNDLATGASLESLLPQLQEELVNAGKLARYKIVTN